MLAAQDAFSPSNGYKLMQVLLLAACQLLPFDLSLQLCLSRLLNTLPVQLLAEQHCCLAAPAAHCTKGAGSSFSTGLIDWADSAMLSPALVAGTE